MLEQFPMNPSANPVSVGYDAYSFSTSRTGLDVTIYSHELVDYMIYGSGLVSSYTGSLNGTGTVFIEFT